MNENLAGALRDIHEIDPVSWWPPALGWWLVAILIIGLLIVLIPILRRVRRGDPALRARWQRDAAHHLRRLRRELGADNTKLVATELSELMRRIAIARCGRAACAGLSGSHWLDWLDAHDPVGFAWSNCREQLLLAPYAPPGRATDTALLRNMLDAALAWTHPGHLRCPTGGDRDV